jgi:hypothetical protein
LTATVFLAALGIGLLYGLAATRYLPANQPEAMVRALDEFARVGARGLSA